MFSPQIFDLMLLNNTVDGVGDSAISAGPGIHLSAEDGAILNARFFNNIISNTYGNGIEVDTTARWTWSATETTNTTSPTTRSITPLGPSSM